MLVTLKDLLTELKKLRVQEERVIQRIDHALQQLHLQEDTVIKQNKDFREKHSPKDTSRSHGPTSTTRPDKTRTSQPASDRQKGVLDFKRGDRVIIKNRTTSSIFNRRASIADKTATVTRVRVDGNGKIEKVFITTDNGLATHRLPKNLSKLE